MADTEIVTALLTAGVSLVTAVGGALYARRNALELQRITTRLDEEGKERDARRDYEYEARKRLYHECEPVLFAIAELAENARGRIQGRTGVPSAPVLPRPRTSSRRWTGACTTGARRTPVFPTTRWSSPSRPRSST